MEVGAAVTSIVILSHFLPLFATWDKVSEGLGSFLYFQRSCMWRGGLSCIQWEQGGKDVLEPLFYELLLYRKEN